ncbi:hypothetical protein HBI56_171580 [Parastagonospora nodorum]|nr:hypothetical protein HBH98_154200 [Parastagonospora nodorum]KAH4370725.1 hypothetical protein HBH97_140980 [Parastagonospora nodorum]KAH4391356.1 hypothetical protein HBH99_151030 [Parastagonospora nodorum]KAH5094618.1 hypothetical protein HBH72_162790 [Parastagonospora nodorum]KAH5177814.1 hypothetical protein HBH77_195640 [Parastagonospora nodorum]
MSLPSTPRWPSNDAGVPKVDGSESFGDLVDKLSQYFEHTIHIPQSFEDFRRSQQGRLLEPLVVYLSNSVHHPALVSALLALKGHFSALEEASDEPGVNEARGYACEHVAWQFLSNLADRDIIDYLLLELPSVPSPSSDDPAEEGLHSRDQNGTSRASERTPLLEDATGGYFGSGNQMAANTRFSSLTSQCENLSALEIAAVSGAKKFLSQRPIQKVINGLWRGDIVFWETLSVHSVKKPRKYNRNHADLFCRLRVPLYLKVFETVFFAVFLALYYAVLVHRDFHRVTIPEILLYVWIASFAYDEFADWIDAGQTSFYASDFWWTWDISIVVVGVIFCILRIVGLSSASKDTIDLAYDVLGLEALFLVPRIFSLLSLNRYFGTLIPCLKEMTKDFVKFLSLVVILYLGFLTTFVLLARDQFKPTEMSWILIKVFFGSSYLGFDIAKEISPFFGPPVMLIFVSLTNILLITSLISLLSNSLSKVLDHARDEYLFIYSVYVLEASSSNRLTYFLPPLNLIPLCIRPFRLVLPSERLRSARIVLLKVTHLPFVAAIWCYEQLADAHRRDPRVMSLSGPQTPLPSKKPLRLAVNTPRLLLADSQATPNSPGNMQQASRPHTRVGPTEPDPQLKTLVLKLTRQVEQLTELVSQLQEQREATVVA